MCNDSSVSKLESSQLSEIGIDKNTIVGLILLKSNTLLGIGLKDQVLLHTIVQENEWSIMYTHPHEFHSILCEQISLNNRVISCSKNSMVPDVLKARPVYKQKGKFHVRCISEIFISLLGASEETISQKHDEILESNIFDSIHSFRCFVDLLLLLIDMRPLKWKIYY